MKDNDIIEKLTAYEHNRDGQDGKSIFLANV